MNLFCSPLGFALFDLFTVVLTFLLYVEGMLFVSVLGLASEYNLQET